MTVSIVIIQASLSFIAMKLYINCLQEFIQYFCFPDKPMNGGDILDF